MVREILQLGNPLLRECSREVEPGNAEAERVLADLRDTLHDFQKRNGFGRGISAVQIGLPLRLIYIEIHGRSYALLNPRLVEESTDKLVVWDDCFSFPNLVVRVIRTARVRVEYTDAEGRAQSLQAEGDLSELLQHEMDHLDGILAVDRAIDRESFATREEYERRYKASRTIPYVDRGAESRNSPQTNSPQSHRESQSFTEAAVRLRVPSATLW